MSDVLLTQTATVVYRVRYTREEMVEILSGIDGDRDLGVLTNGELAQLLVDAANATADNEHNENLYAKLVEDAGDSDETIDVDDWQVTEVYTAEEIPTP